MEEERNTMPWLVKALIVIGALALIGYLLWSKGVFNHITSTDEKVVQTEIVEDNPLVVTLEEWEATVNEVGDLRNEVERLKQEVQRLKNTKPAASPQQAPAATAAPAAPVAQQATQATQQPSATFDPNAVSLANYTHDWTQPNASVSLKNNTDHRISQVSGRMVYYDMSGNMLDYQDFTKSVDIEPGMVKGIILSGYGYKDHYAYYKNDTYNYDRKYKVVFELKSYK